MNNPLRVVLAGCGGISAEWLRAAAQMPDLAIVGLVDLRLAAAEARAVEFGLTAAQTGDDLVAMLAATQPDIVFNVTIPAAHLAVTLTALAQGCHVLCEKPLADSMDAARRTVAAAEDAGRLVAIIQNRRYQPQIRRLRRLIAAQQLGALTTLTSDFYLGPRFGGFRDEMQHVLLLDMAIHTFDMARFLIGADPVAVFCKEWNPAGSWYAHGASAIALFEMSDGSVYSYRGSWCAEGAPTSWESSWRIVGSSGSALWDGAEQLTAAAVSGPGGFFADTTDLIVPALADDDRIGGHAGLIAEFAACVRAGTTPETHVADNIKSLAMVFAAIESATTRRMVDVMW
ncbi:Gfo/Idh/MocA family oxidoreductase [Candidatus Gracilibacteria bacterium]|nr:Gfo/Idh/MocA family oxidoreductase [Candidatus Gracilibacteria bacterium]